MLNRDAVRARLAELSDEVDRKTADFEAGRIADKNYYRKFVQKAWDESTELKAELKTYETAARWSGGTEVNADLSGGPGVADYGRIQAASPMDLTPAQIGGLMQAAQHRTPYSVTIQPKSFKDGVRMKAGTVTEGGLGGSFSGNLPPVQSLYAVGLGYEPTRIADLLPGAAMPGPSATWLSHTANTNEVAVVAEGGTKLDIGPTVTESQVKPTKIAAMVSTTLEAEQDTGLYGDASFASWLPTELTRSLVNEESNLLLNATTGTATFAGLLQVSGTLTRSMGTDSPLDCLSKAYVDLRTGSAFANPDLVLMNPSTLGALRRQKSANGNYIMDLLAGPLGITAFGQPSTAGPAGEPNKYSVIPQATPGLSGQLWGAAIATSTQIAAGTAVVMSVAAGAGIFWQRMGLVVMYNPWSAMSTNVYQWFAEERIAYSCPRPAALNIVTGLPTA
ncbi:MAG: phage major capsid protein [Bryobacteraceae bacterium]